MINATVVALQATIFLMPSLPRDADTLQASFPWAVAIFALRAKHKAQRAGIRVAQFLTSSQRLSANNRRCFMKGKGACIGAASLAIA